MTFENSGSNFYVTAPKERSLGCVNSCPAARENQEAGFTQPRDHSLAEPCTRSVHGKSKYWSRYKDLRRTDQSLVKTLVFFPSRDYQSYHGDTRENRNSRQLLFYERLIQTILVVCSSASKSAARHKSRLFIQCRESLTRMTKNKPRQSCTIPPPRP